MFLHLSIERDLGYFQIWDIINKAVINNCAQKVDEVILHDSFYMTNYYSNTKA